MEEDTTDGARVPEELSPLRTYKHDVAESLRGENMSMANIAIAQQARRQKEAQVVEKEIRTSKALVWIIGILVLSALLILGYVLLFRPGGEVGIPAPAAPFPTSLLVAEGKEYFDLTDKKPRVAYAELSAKAGATVVRPDTMIEIVPTLSGTSTPPQATIPSLEIFFGRIGVEAPEKLLRFLGKRFMFGIYSFRTADAFLLVEPISFGPVFAEMLGWEREMPGILYPLLTSKSLTPNAPIFWEDALIRNVDVRVGKEKGGQIVLLYAFLPSKDRLVIAASLDTFNEVLLRSQSKANVIQ